MSAKVWIDGRLVDKLAATVSVFDHGLLFGDGVWVGTRIYAAVPFQLAEYLDQLHETAEDLHLPVLRSRADLADAVALTVRANNRTEGYVRVTVTRGAGTLGLDPRKCGATVVVVADDVVPYPREVYDAGLDVVTSRPNHPLRPGTLSQVGAIKAKVHALQAGCLEALLTDTNDGLLFPTDGDVYLVAGGRLRHRPADKLADRVIGRFVGGLASGLGAEPLVGHLTRADLFAADEVFFASAAAEVIAVRSVNGTPVGGGAEGPVTRQLREAFRRAVRAEG